MTGVGSGSELSRATKSNLKGSSLARKRHLRLFLKTNNHRAQTQNFRELIWNLHTSCYRAGVSKTEKIFIVAYLFALALTMLFSAEVDSSIVFLTFLFAFPLFVAAPNLAIYGLPIGLAILMAHTGVNRTVARFIGLAGVALIAVVPVYLSEKAAREQAARFASGDVIKSGYPSVRHLEIRQPYKTSGKSTPLRHASCGSICQKLLTGSEMDRVTVTALGSGRRVLHAVTYAFEPRPSCPNLDVAPDLYLAHTKWLNRRGRCIVTVPSDQAGPSQLTVSLLTADDYLAFIEGIEEKDLGPELHVRRMEISDPTRSPADRLRFRKTEVQTKILSFPFRITIGTRRLELWFEAARRPLIVNWFDTEGVLGEQLGFKLAVPNVEKGSDMQLEISNLLARPGNEAVSAVHGGLITEYAKSLKAKAELSASEIETLRRLIADNRFRDLYFVASVLRKFPELAERFVPLIVDRLSVPTPESRGHSHSAFASVLTGVDPAKLRPYAARLVEIIDKDRQWTTAPLLNVIGRLGVDPEATFAHALLSRSQTVRGNALLGLCLADPQWRDVLRPYLRNYMRGQRWHFSNVEAMAYGLQVLRVYGDEALADDLAGGLIGNARERLEREQVHASTKYARLGCTASH